MSKGCIGI